MMKRIGFMVLLLVFFAAFALPVTAAGAAERDPEDLTLGVVIPYEIGWFSAFKNGFEIVAEQEGVDLVWQYHEYQPDLETRAVENLIAMGVDAINITSATPESAEYSCRLANQAGIPIQVTESGVAEGEGEPFADIDFDWYNIYQELADELYAAESGDLEILWLQGFLGSPPVMQGIEGFKDALAGIDRINLATEPQDGQYATEPSLEITKGMVQGGLDFNVAIGASQEITEGIIQGLREEGVSLDDVIVITVNGGPTDVVNLRNGNIDYCMSLSPGLHAMICAQNLINRMTGREYQEKAYSPIVWCTQDNWEEKLIPWGVDEAWMPVVEDFIATGEYNPDLRP